MKTRKTTAASSSKDRSKLAANKIADPEIVVSKKVKKSAAKRSLAVDENESEIKPKRN